MDLQRNSKDDAILGQDLIVAVIELVELEEEAGADFAV